MIDFVAKLFVVGGAVSGIVLLDGIGMNTNRKGEEEKVQKNNEDPTFKSIKEIELFENAHGCTFTYIESWENKALYTARAMLENVKVEGRNIQDEILQAANLPKAKTDCKEKKGVITLTNNGTVSGKANTWAVKTDNWN